MEPVSDADLLDSYLRRVLEGVQDMSLSVPDAQVDLAHALVLALGGNRHEALARMRACLEADDD